MATTPPAPPPVNLPPVEVRAPDIEGYAMALLNGLAKWGGWGAGGPAPVLKQFVTDLLVVLVGIGVGSIGEVSKWIGQLQQQVEDDAGGKLLEAAVTGLNDFFNLNLSAASLRGGREGAGGSAAASQISDAVMAAMFGAFGSNTQITPEQGFENAKKVVAFNVQTSLEGWFMGVLSSGVLSKWFPNWADLDDIMVESLGLGRVTRQALHPLIQALITDPTEQYVLKTYRPTLLAPAAAVDAVNAGDISEERFFDNLARRGYTQDDAAILRKQGSRRISESDIRTGLDTRAFGEETARELLRAIGYTPDQADLKLRLFELARVQAVNEQVAAAARDMFRDRVIEEGTYRSALTAAGFSSEVTEGLLGLGRLERGRPTQLPRGTIEDAYVDGLVDLNRLRRFYETAGYSFEDQITLEVLALRKRLDAEKRRAAAAAKEAEVTNPALPRGVAEDLYLRGLIAEGELAAAYADLGFQAARVELLMRLARARRQERVQREEEQGQLPAGPPPPRAALEEAFRRGIISEDRLDAVYRAGGVSDADRPALLEVQRQRKAEEDQRRAEEDARRAAGQRPRPRPVPQAVVEELYRVGLLTAAQLGAYYRTVPYDDAAIPLLLEAAARRRAAYEAGQAAKAAPPPATDIPRSTMEAAFERGIVDEAALRAWYVDQGYTAEDTELLLELARIRAEDASAALATRAAARA
jgi:hypothetical protein